MFTIKSSCFFFLLLLLQHLHAQQRFDYPTAKPSTSWTNGPNLPHTISYPDGSTVKALLLRSPAEAFGPSFAFGFYCRAPKGTSSCTDYLLAIFIVYTNSGALITSVNMAIPQVVWSANQNRPVKQNAVLAFTADGNLILKDADGTVVWSSGTAGRSAVSLSITDTGNLVLLDARGSPVWQSFDHPTDALLPGQKLFDGQTLFSNVSNWDFKEGFYSLTATSAGFRAVARTNPPQLYYEEGTAANGAPTTKNYLLFQNGSLSLFESASSQLRTITSLPPAPSAQYMRLELDGHLRVYQWTTGEGGGTQWKAVADVVKFFVGECGFPTVCGRYGICSSGQCSCPRDAKNRMVNYFLPVSDRHPNLGCEPVTPVDCRSGRMLRLDDISYFGYADKSLEVKVKEIDGCASACRRRCSCRGAFFEYGTDPRNGLCYLVRNVLSMIDHDREARHFNSTAFLKV